MNPSALAHWVLILQRTGVVMSQAHHSRHHITYDNNFAIFTGWTNPLLNACVRLGFIATSPWWVLLFGIMLVLPLLVSLRLADARPNLFLPLGVSDCSALELSKSL